MKTIKVITKLDYPLIYREDYFQDDRKFDEKVCIQIIDSLLFDLYDLILKMNYNILNIFGRKIEQINSSVFKIEVNLEFKLTKYDSGTFATKISFELSQYENSIIQRNPVEYLTAEKEVFRNWAKEILNIEERRDI